MTTIVTRLYEDAKTAENVASDIRAMKSVPDDAVAVYGEAKGKKASDLRKALMAARMTEDAAGKVQGMLTDGRTLVIAKAPWGTAAAVISKADGAGPVDMGMGSDAYFSERMGASAASNLVPGGTKYLTSDGPLSDGPTPLSSFFGWRTLSDRRPSTDILRRGDKAKIMPGKPLSDWKLGTKMITENTTVFSKRIGMSTLKERPATRSLLDMDKTPFSTALGMKTLTDN